MTKKLTPPQALIYAMIATSAVDARMSESELQRIGTIIKELPVFVDFDENRLIAEAQACQRVVSGEDGLERVLDLIAGGLTPSLHETAYVLAAEIAAADLKVAVEERRFLQLLAGRLRLDRLVAVALERAAAARHRTA
ncbi:MAG: tellurite resistance TerB family protein [Hyphomicrobiaceae bacterium]